MTIEVDETSLVSNYARWLDLDEGVMRTRWTQEGLSFVRYDAKIISHHSLPIFMRQ
jgi:hypothetical protein